ncbi:MAG TPA: DUF1269 domain-containing protein [Ktedonobacterales bacterium]|jgi:uncharacterized membrane protein
MSNLIAITYPDEYRAAEVMATLRRLSGAYLIDLEDAVYVTKDAQSKIKLYQSRNLTGEAAGAGALWGALIGLIFFMPIAGAAIGAGMGALAGKFSDYGIDDNFVKQLGQNMPPNSSAIFVLVRKATPDKVLPEVSKYGGTIIQTSLPKEAEERLQAALEQGGGPKGPLMQQEQAPGPTPMA